MAWSTASVSLGETTKKSHFDQLLDNDVYLLALIGQSTPPGIILPYAGLTAPTGFLLCDGSAISRTTYSSLYDVITASKGSFTVSIASPGVITLNTHGFLLGSCVELTTTGALPTGLSVNTNYYVIYVNANTFQLATSYANAIAGTAINTSGTQSGTHTLRSCPYGISTSANFLLPDTRGIFLSGAGVAGTMTNANGAAFSRVQGGYQNDKMQGHVHTFNYRAAQVGSGSSYERCQSGYSSTPNWVTNPYTDGTNGTPRTGAETNPANLAVNHIIKY